MTGKYLTVTEFAEKAGVSTQTVYDQIRPGKRLHPYVRKINGKKHIRMDGLNYYTGRSEDVPEGDPDHNREAGAGDPFIAILQEQLRTKDEQIRAKDEQIKAKDEQIKDLTEAVKAGTALQYRLQEQIALLTGETEQEAQQAASDDTEAQAASQSVTEGSVQQVEQPQPEPMPERGGLFGWLSRLWR